MKKRTIFAGLGVLAVLGLVLAVGAALDLGSPGPHGMRGNRMEMTASLGLSENATPEDIWVTMFDKKIADLGLTEDSTIGELKAALVKQRSDMPAPTRNATCGRMFADIPRRPQNATFEDMPTMLRGSGNRTCPMGHGGRMDELMFGI